uniref:Virion structural protein n=1 Tax=Salmonella phage vB_STmST313_KE31 TaxID=3161181 RepID=A0AAU8GM51_9CAUD
MSSIEQLITPQYVYSNIVEHLRSQLNVKQLNSSELSGLEITEVEVAAFGSRYHFVVNHTQVEQVTSSIIDLGATKPSRAEPKSVTRNIAGYLEETLEPGATHPIFNFNATVVNVQGS